ncbi:MAG: translation initiation factor IF-2 [Deltaproteobacteria bacterium]|nr:translation initiation factor IF-2 [Deltaproteobacteria bacterium]
MVRMRVHELAKKLGLENKELIDKLNKAGLDTRSHSSTIDETEAMRALQPAAPARPATVTRSTVVRRAAPEAAVIATTAVVPPPATPTAVTSPPTATTPATVVRAAPDPTRPAIVTRAPEPTASAGSAAAEFAPSGATATSTPGPAAASDPAAVASAAAAVSPAAPVAAAPTTPPADAAGSGVQNITRVIDADTIRARLAGEGRVLGPSGPRRAGPGGRGPIREVRVINDRFGGPQMVDVTGAARGRPNEPGAPTGDAARRGTGDRRQAGRDIWFNPGEKKRTGKKGKQTEVTQAAAHKRVVEMSELISVGELAHQMAIKSGQVISKLFSMGMMVTVNQTIDFDTAGLIASEFGFEVKNVAFTEENLLDVEKETATGSDVVGRPPVVTIMGHVDHGKTSLLDRIRNADVAAGEAGGITQHIGAYQVETSKGKVTFLDTPGHAAFTAMRARGAQVTDIVILVVAADDGCMPQTIEALNHAKAAKVPIMVALNKADKPDAKPERVMQQLTEHGLVSEEWGGETIMIPVSARTGMNIDKLLDSILLVAEVAELKAAPDRRGEGTIVEAELDKGRGPVATVLVQQGTLKVGDYIVAGEHSGKVRAMLDDRGQQVKEAGPSMPVQVLGLAGVPDAGDKLNAVADEKTARTVAEHRQTKAREEQLRRANQNSMSNLLDFVSKSANAEQQLELKIIVKADVGGSVEAISNALEKLSTKKVKVVVVTSGVGTITESDVNLALASRAMVVGFNSKPDAKAASVASHEKVEVRSYSIIYELLDDVKRAMSQLLAPKVEEKYLGRAEIRQLFTVPKLGVIAGSYIVDGKIVRSERARIKRGNAVVHEGTFASLKRFKDDAREVAAGFECGIGFVSFTDFQPGDVVECFELVEVAADLGEAIDPTAAALTGAGKGTTPAASGATA